jgi:NAD(P)-dependent dehydrogenase (short-subunit alcohol dehydrogenase family)
MADVAHPPDYLSLLNLKGRGFVVLGAGQGIGEQSAHALAQAGAKLVCVDSDAGRAEAIARAINGHACVADVTKRDDVARIFKEARTALGAVCGVVDIVGVARLKALADFSDEEWDWQFGIILRHAFLTLQYGAAAIAEAGGGTLTFVGSLAGARSIRKQVAYGTAKAALHHLVRGAAQELAPQHIRVNAVAPGFVRTPRLEQMLSPEQWREIEGRIPLGKAARPAEIAGPILFLASDLSSHITGQIVAVDGGLNNAAALPDIKWGQAARPTTRATE